jgi:trehalose 6-phosphate phosphatase
MQPLFSPEGERALRDVLRLAPLLAFDFDGTLAPIVERPGDAAVPPAIGERMQRLVQVAPVAIVTGRSIADVAPRLGFAPRYLIGNHGAEDPARAPPSADALQGIEAALAALRTRIAARSPALRQAGVQVEDKRHSMAFHYRQAEDHDAARRSIEALLAGLDPALKAYGGKCVVNLVAAASPDKGDAVHALVARSGVQAAVFVGDDLNDEAVFAQAEPHWLTVRVGRSEQSQAMYFLDRHDEMAALLDRLLAGA